MNSEEILKIQKQVIYLLTHDKNLVSSWIEGDVKIKHFDSRFHFILNVIIDCYDKSVLLTARSFKTFLEKVNNTQDKMKQEVLLDECFCLRADPNDFPILLKNIKDFYLRDRSQLAMRKYGDSISKNKNNIQISLQNFIDNLEKINEDASSNGEVIYQDMRTFSKSRLDYIDDVRGGRITEPPRVLCNIPEIDETMMTGFGDGTLTIFCGEVGGFKSTMMLNIGLNIWENEYDVLFVPIEMSYEKMYNRAWSRQARVPSEKIADPTKLSDEEREKLKQAQDDWDNRGNSSFYVLEMPDETRVNDIRRQIDRYVSVFQPKAVVIDYIDNLEPDKSRDSRRDLEIRDMIVTLRKMGQRRGFSVVSGAQLGKEALKKIRKTGGGKSSVSINSEDIRGAHTTAMYADNVYALMRNTSQPNALLDIFVIKARDGKTTFPNGQFKATLLLSPDIGLIQSEEELSITDDENVLEKIWDGEEGGDISFEEDI